jgi:carbon monoxide dehydrogenase subunit G
VTIPPFVPPAPPVRRGQCYTVKLQANGEGTLLIYSAKTQIGGKLAQLGQRLINGAAKKVADQFLRILLG